MTAASHRVLVAEDQPINARLLGLLLGRLGFPFELVADGSQAIDRLRSGGAFAVVLMDLRMPVMDGLESARRIRAGEAGEAARAIPIVAVTAADAEADREACRAAGMEHFLAKPVGGEDLAGLFGRLGLASPPQEGSGS